ncbi:MAG: hypothetical protein ACTHXA_02935 [Gulosibacter sp.]|uniref:hypothetical protein n=1 Tax=Gulosibacter sp. TaxID=2817531 RepID=UPI003F9339C2
MAITIAEYAEKEGISVQRARELARNGRIPARKFGGSWVVESGSARQSRSQRPLSPTSQADLIAYFNTRSLLHVNGTRRARLAERVRKLQDAENPAALIRQYFAGSQASDGIGGAAIIRAALRGFDVQVREVLQVRHRLFIRSSADLARVMLDSRALLGEESYRAATEQWLTKTQIRQLERGNRSAVAMPQLQQVLSSMGLQVSKIELPRKAANV